MTNHSRHEHAAQLAGAIFARRESILAEWLSLIELDSGDSAAEFARDQLDATILALAGWINQEDPAVSTMSLQWTGIRPTRELVARAVISMSLLPEAVRRGLAGIPNIETEAVVRSVAPFSGEVTAKILRGANFGLEDERWEDVAREIEERHESQRIVRLRRLNGLIEIARAVSTSQDTDSLLEQVHLATARITRSDYTEISLLEPDSETLRRYLVYSKGSRRTDLETVVQERDLAGDVLRSGSELAFSDYRSTCYERGIRPRDTLDDGLQRAWMGAPMLQGDKAIGVIAVSRPLTAFEREDLELIAAVARQTAVALSNRRLIEAERRHVAQLRAVNHLSRGIAALRKPDQLLETATELIHQYYQSSEVTALLFEPASGLLRKGAQAPARESGDVPASDEKVSQSIAAAQVLATRQAFMDLDFPETPEQSSMFDVSTTRAELAVPIIHSGRLIGVLDLRSPSPSAFDRHDVTTLQTMADQIAIGLENSRLFADEAQRAREIRLMLRTTQAASSSLQLDEVLERLAEGIADAAGAESCLVHLYDAEERHFRPAVMVGPNDNGRLAAFNDWERVLRTDDHPELRQILDDEFPIVACPIQRSSQSRDPSITVLVPLRARQRTLGMAVIASDTTPGQVYPASWIRLIQGVADSAALAVENARLYARVHGLAIAEERGRLAQEIHDTLAQGLTGISLQLELADSYLPGNPDQAAKNVERALELSRQNLDEARRSVLDLRAADVHHMSLPDAISLLLRRLGNTTRISYEFGNEGFSSRLSARVEVGLYRIVEEAVENARRHSGASKVRVMLNTDGNTVSLLIEDNGHGFDPSYPSQQDCGTAGFGLLGIRERARLLGGSLAVSSHPGAGTTIRVSLPYEARVHSAERVPVDRGEIG